MLSSTIFLTIATMPLLSPQLKRKETSPPPERKQRLRDIFGFLIAELPDRNLEHPLLTPMLDIIPATEDMLLSLPLYV
jgi:hypothetical protein